MPNEKINPLAVKAANEINRAAANFDDLLTDKKVAEIINRICFGEESPSLMRDELFEKLVFALNGIVRDLPANKDWLDPDLEAIARQAIESARTSEAKNE